MEPAEALQSKEPRLFLVIASSPRRSRWEGVIHYRPPVDEWFMMPFTLSELIQAYVFHAHFREIANLLLQSPAATAFLTTR